MKFSNSKEFKDAFAFEFYEQIGVEENKDIDHLRFLDLYLQVAECKKIRLGYRREIFLFPDYDKQIYVADIVELFRQLNMLARSLEIPALFHLVENDYILKFLQTSTDIRKITFAPTHYIQTNLGVMNTLTKELVKEEAGLFTNVHQIDKFEFKKANKKIMKLFSLLANQDIDTTIDLYTIAYFTLLGYGFEHMTFVTGKHSHNKHLFLLLLRALASEESSEKISFRDLINDDHLASLDTLISLYYNPEIPENIKFITYAKESFSDVVKNRHVMISRKYLAPAVFYHRGMNVHCIENVPDGFFEMQDLSENVWEVNITPDKADQIQKQFELLLQEFNVESEEQLLDHPEFARQLISTVLYALEHQFNVPFSQMPKRLQERSQQLKEARLERVKQLAKEAIKSLK
jgi:hypothetical protein